MTDEITVKSELTDEVNQLMKAITRYFYWVMEDRRITKQNP